MSSGSSQQRKPRFAGCYVRTGPTTSDAMAKKKRSRSAKPETPVELPPAPASNTSVESTSRNSPTEIESEQPGNDAKSDRPVAVPREEFQSKTISNAFRETHTARRARLGLPVNDNDPTFMMVELNLHHAKGLSGAEARFIELFRRGLPDADLPQKIAETYYRCRMTVRQAEQLTKTDQHDLNDPQVFNDPRDRAIYHIWPDFRVLPLIDQSIAIIKADAARRSYDAAGEQITWAVIDSGIDKNHPHFAHYDNLGGDVADLHWDFTLPDIDPAVRADPAQQATLDAEVQKRIDGALVDTVGHGTHVAGILAGGLHPSDLGKFTICVGRRTESAIEERSVSDASRLSGVAPRTKLVSLKVLADGMDSSSTVIRALQHVRQRINGEGKIRRVHGVNLSLGYEFDARWFACGQSPICVEVDRLVRSGVVVVVAAGNTGYGNLSSSEGITSSGMALTINDPGNAVLAITVGSTHRNSPYTYGVSYFSSKGPTGDGRLKPDLVAPGERITSCAVGKYRDALASLPSAKSAGKDIATYLDDSGTSMAAPHVSGAIAAFLSIRREFIGRPDDVTRIFLETATSLKREPYFEGRGLVDLMRAIQSV